MILIIWLKIAFCFLCYIFMRFNFYELFIYLFKNKINTMKLKSLLVIAAMAMFMWSCGGGEKPAEKAADAPKPEFKSMVADEVDPLEDKGVGLFTDVDIPEEIDQKLVAEGEAIFTEKCTACHKFGSKLVGPDLVNVTKRRSPEWMMNMMTDPEKMLAENDLAKELLAELKTPMTNQQVSKENARAIYEFLRTK